jgi:aminopeptidase N
MQRSLISLAVLGLLNFSSVTATAASAAHSSNDPKAQATTQLPRTAVPTHYAVSLTPDAANSSFSATVTIALDANKATNSLTLNAADLKFSAAAISASAGEATLPSQYRIK